MGEGATNGRGWYRDSMPLIVALVGGVFALASKIESCGAKREAVVANAVAGAAFETSDSLRITAGVKSDSLRVAYERINALEATVGKLNTPAVRRVIAATRRGGAVSEARAEARAWWKPWTWG